MSEIHQNLESEVSAEAAPFERLPGEQDFLAVSKTDSGDGVALAYPVDEDGVPIRCSLFITNYRTVVIPMRGRLISVPHLMLESWELLRRPMTATHRAAFPQVHPPLTANSSTLPQQQPQSAGAVAGGPFAFTLTMNTKYLWSVKVIFQDERQASTARKLIDSLRPAHLKNMPAFELYRALNEVQQSAEEDGKSSLETSTLVDAAACAANTADGDSWVNYGWNLFNCKRELERQLCVDPSTPVPALPEEEAKCGPGQDLRNWFRTTAMGQDDFMFGRSPTYPFHIVAPNFVSDPLLVECIYSRSRGRIPAISFVHFGTGAVLARCSQPISKGDLRKDGELCYALVNCGYSVKNAKPREVRYSDPAPASSRSVAPPPSLIDGPSQAATAPVSPASISVGGVVAARKGARTLMVADCRPYAAAYGNQTMGGGFESGPTHDFCKVKFFGIDNIHGVTKAFNKLKNMLHNFNGRFPKEGFYDQLHDSQWLYHIQRVLMCSAEIAEGLDRGDSYLVHCTDGWDRTSQCTSIAMMLLDPFYRTTVGFCILIEKEFCVFGHKFAERCSHMVPGDTYYQSESGVSSSDTESQHTQQTHKLQPSPIFVQWLDAVFQVIRQFPNAFEFTPKLLELLAEEVYSCLYGTFLVNSDKERTFEGVKLKTQSLWTRIVDAVQREKDGAAPLLLLNSFYDAHNAWRYISKSEGNGINLLPVSCSSKRLVFWEEHYLRYDSDHLNLRVSDHAANMRVDAVRRTTAPYFCAPLEAYLNAVIARARADRQQDAAYMAGLLTRLVVQRPPPVTATQQSNSKAAPVDTKSCWICHEKFGFFGTKEFCSFCATKVPLCSKCIRSVNGKKLCPTCVAINDVDDE